MRPPGPDADTLLHFWVAPALGTWAPGATLRGLDEPTVPDGATTADLPPPPPRVERNVDTVDLSFGPTIGKGGMGVVRSATQHSLDREVAVKVVSSDRPASVRALLREARVAGRLEHPSIVPVHALCWTDEGPVLVMKRIDGASWRELIANPRHPLWASREGEPLEWHLEVLQEVCHALELAHSRGVLHRDIKPENVMVGAFGEVSLLDWGIALLLDEASSTGKRPRLVGTPAFMAPEMATPGAPQDTRTDVFLLGATLHQALTGQRRNNARTALAALEQAVACEPFAYGPEIPADLAAIANRACAREPEDRFPDVASFRAAIEGHRAHRGSLAASREAMAELLVLESMILELGTRPRTDRDETHLEVVRRFSACRFGFAQALREWPENSQAVGGLDQAMRTMVRYELRRGDPGAAAAILAETASPDPELVARVEAARAEQGALLAEGTRMVQMKDELRVAGKNWGRSVATVVSGVAGLGILVLAGVLQRGAGGEVNGLLFAAACAVCLLINIVGVGVFRRTLLDNRAYLRLMLVLNGLWALGIFVGVGGALVSASWPALLLAMCSVITGVCATLAVTFDSLFVGSALLAAGVSLVALALPAYGCELVGLGYLVHSLWFAVVLRPRNAPTPAASGPAMWQ